MVALLVLAIGVCVWNVAVPSASIWGAFLISQLILLLLLAARFWQRAVAYRVCSEAGAKTLRPADSIGAIRYNTQMPESASAITRSPAEIVQNNPVSQAANGICYARSGEITIADNDLERMIAAVPVSVASALNRKAYYFVPLTVTQGEDTVIADRYDVALSDNAVATATWISAMPSVFSSPPV